MSVPEIPGYRLVRELGRGGMATVYLAIQEKFDREVAVKIMDRELLHDETFSKRFQRESRIVARLNHPHIIQVYDVGLVDENHYLSMELVTGGELDDRLGSGLGVKEAFRIIREIARALDFAHSKGFVHRDIKPENILFREEGSAVLSDFGIARGMDNETRITTMGSVVGTPYYMSPEQVTGEKLDGRADLYSLGVVFYKTLTGKVPYDGDSALNIGIRHIKDPVPKLPPGLSKLQPLIDRFMAKAPADRFQSGAEVIEELDRFERSGSMPGSVARTEVLDADVVNEIKRSTGQSKARSGSRPGVTRVMQLGRKRTSPVKFLVVGVSLALIIGGAAWFLLQARDTAETPAETEPRQPDIAPLLERGEALLASGDLLTPADANALDSYRQALDLAPDSEAARAGLEAVGRALAEEGTELLEQGDAAAARERLELAEELATGTTQVSALAGALEARAASASLVQRIREQMEAGNLTTPADESAVALVRRGLAGPGADRIAPLRDELVARLEQIAAEAREFDMDDAARPYAEAAQELAARGEP